MATKKIELEVDFIGGEGALTTAEEKALSDFFKQRKKAKNGKRQFKTLLKSKPSGRQVEVLA
jgi:hypothetical protein